MKIRAIYKPDMIYGKCMVFELQNDKFVSLDDSTYRYDMEIVFSDNDWLIAIINEDENKIENIR